MTPAEYYYGRFPNDFRSFWLSLEKKGSCSRARAHQRQTFWGEHLKSTLQDVFPAREGRFSVADLFVAPQSGLPDHLIDINAADYIDFIFSIFYTVLIDQVVYSHCQVDYPVFRDLTAYPKMDRTVGWARTLMMANPYEVFCSEVLEPRGIRSEEVFARFRDWAPFIVSDLRNVFSEHFIGSSNWAHIRQAMLSDPDCSLSPYGVALRSALFEHGQQL